MKKQEFNKLDDKTKKALLQEKRILNNTKDVESIINVDLDNKNLMNELSKLSLEKESKTKIDLYKYDTLIDNYINLSNEDKKKKETQIRKRLRKQLKSISKTICLNFQESNKEQLKESIKNFETIYKTNYVFNDYTLNSLVGSSANNETKLLITLMLNCIKNSK